MISDENGRLHRLRRNLGGLRYVTRKHENENDGEEEAFDPLPHDPFLQNRSRVEYRQFVQSDIGAIESYKLMWCDIGQPIGDFAAFHLRTGSFDHLREFFLYKLADSAAISGFSGKATHRSLHH